MPRILECTGAIFLFAVMAQAGERVVLTNGFELHAERHELAGSTVRFYEGESVTEFPATMIAEYQVEDAVSVAEIEKVDAPFAVPLTSKPLTPHELVKATIASNHLPSELVALVESVIRQESGFHADAISPKGAVGLMQLMPATARQLGVDPRDPAQNIEAGTRYLTALLKKYESHPDDQVVCALAAYNAGPGAIEKYHGIPPYAETREYVRRVVSNYLAEQKKAKSE